mmetsp:Transcript_29149/g.34351  ORF Transcript_29149/g.34351 Transcript_29149/m.34351 type:complete len:191 (-) Transcript_29149:65-637(-)|eukprot:CAMPEP_0114329680 /NCGR_PEP_ID=MMETSP0101-20121206/1229_1 /TAXON_ID=38822 ORGANISM="Pteridomonas danica, Strain PT" /NCGR_SAMPLE_ID=MMETSP0101 /ASSEMBLY_ACC=CAM_ASM_000211 /LENGTH=190 /DNA_ID=CAMNT_0001459405 /DNA_START=44 /DNA_END=616 /DNA_ORIENTATION=+
MESIVTNSLRTKKMKPDSSLLQRLNAFLPQMASANQILEEQNNLENHLDANLVRTDEHGDHDEELDDNPDHESSIQEQEAEESGNEEPCIQIEFAIGDFDQSLAAQLEGDDASTNGGKDDAENSNDQIDDFVDNDPKIESRASSLIVDLLEKSSSSSVVKNSDNPDASSSSLTDDEKKETTNKRLIEEIS